MKKLLLVIALVVIAACSNNGSRAEGTGLHDLAASQAQRENIEPSNAAMTAANMKGVAVAQAAALTGAEVGCAALAQMVALAQEAAQTGGEIQDASWLAEWKTVREL
ncbi:MAG: hypothetical protein JHC90_07095 [Ilumatobacteraceae bacterium]|jgi:hypothetical protein|nr:hypothetical protein [Ilumatobacteraceae bacterium]